MRNVVIKETHFVYLLISNTTEQGRRTQYPRFLPFHQLIRDSSYGTSIQKSQKVKLIAFGRFFFNIFRIWRKFRFTAQCWRQVDGTVKSWRCRQGISNWIIQWEDWQLRNCFVLLSSTNWNRISPFRRLGDLDSQFRKCRFRFTCWSCNKWLTSVTTTVNN